MLIDWVVSPGLTDYEEAVAAMEARVAAIRNGSAAELVWLLEHPPLYTAGTGAAPEDLRDPTLFPVYATGRGGQHTYHGPGQRVAYVLLDLKARQRHVRAYVRALEDWLIATLATFNICGVRRAGRVGVWVVRESGVEEKIAAIGVRIRRWVTYHGVSLNVEPDLDHYCGIVPCGEDEHGVTSLVDLGIPVTMAEVDASLEANFERIFGPTRSPPGESPEQYLEPDPPRLAPRHG